MQADDKRHGTEHGARRHRLEGEQPCEACYEGHRRYYRRYHKERRKGYVRRLPIGTGGVWNEIDKAYQWGYTFTEIANAVGVSRAHLYNIHAEGPQRKVTPKTWQALRKFNVRQLRGSPTGTIRRLQALHAAGWTSAYVMRQAGMEAEPGKRALRGEHTTFQAHSREAIADVYDRLEMQTPPPGRHTTRARNRAKREGWAPPLAWDNIDDPNEQPTVDAPPAAGIDEIAIWRRLNGDKTVKLSKAEQDEAWRRWTGTYHQFEQTTGINVLRAKKRIQGAA